MLRPWVWIPAPEPYHRAIFYRGEAPIVLDGGLVYAPPGCDIVEK
jgi:hypothetical protein